MTSKDYFKIISLLVIGLAAIVYFNPLHTACQSQLGIYTESLKPMIKTFKKNLELCKQRTEPGGCLPFFEVMTRIDSKINELGGQCQEELHSDSNAKIILTSSMEMIVRGAWGSKPPASYLYKNGWLELSHIALYCKLRIHFEKIFGTESLNSFTNGLLTELPGAASLSRTEVWNRSLMSDPCKYNF